MKEQNKKEEAIEWDKKKILIFLFTVFILIVLGYELKTIILGEDYSENKSLSKAFNQNVKGIEAQKIPLKSPSIKENIQNEINNLKTEAQNINLVDIASSSPQVQKVINDLKALQNYPSSRLKETCEKICSGL